jgi:hypothetical protein
MKMSATEFRKNLFSVLERVLEGEAAEVIYKGSSIKLTHPRSSSKLARAKRQHALIADPGAIVESDRDLLAKMETQWRKDWRKL